MRPYLESPVVQRSVVEFFSRGKPVGAMCHGVLVAARSIDPATGASVLRGRRTTALTWQLERKAWAVARRTRFWDPSYYRTYSEGPGQPEGLHVGATGGHPGPGPPRRLPRRPCDAPDYRLKTSGRARDSATDARPAWVVRDGNLHLGTLAR